MKQNFKQKNEGDEKRWKEERNRVMTKRGRTEAAAKSIN